MLFTVLFSSSLEAQSTWQLTKQKEGIQVYVRDNPNSPLKVFRGIITLSDTKLNPLVAVLEDVKAMPKLLHNCQSANTIKKDGNTSSTIYVVTKMPWPVKNRDSIVHSVMTQDKKTRKVLIKMQSRSKAVPLKKGMVRVQTLSGYWEFMPVIIAGKDSGKIKVTYELSLDPGGNLPKWMVNVLAVDFPFNTLRNLRKLVQKPVYRDAKRPYIID
jgi:hypothetical protein